MARSLSSFSISAASSSKALTLSPIRRISSIRASAFSPAFLSIPTCFAPALRFSLYVSASRRISLRLRSSSINLSSGNSVLFLFLSMRATSSLCSLIHFGSSIMLQLLCHYELLLIYLLFQARPMLRPHLCCLLCFRLS